MVSHSGVSQCNHESDLGLSSLFPPLSDHPPTPLAHHCSSLWPGGNSSTSLVITLVRSRHSGVSVSSVLEPEKRGWMKWSQQGSCYYVLVWLGLWVLRKMFHQEKRVSNYIYNPWFVFWILIYVILEVFSLFSIVQFPNQDCDTTDVNVKKGVCVTSTECSDGSGTAAGNCASGFGVCCIFKTSDCGTTISKNISYIQNPSYPSTYSTTGTCSYKVSKVDSSVCQLRLDFDTLVLGGNDATGSHAGCCGSTCGTVAGDSASDSLSVAGQSGKNPPTICHTNTGYHSKIIILL